jgi:hypothetical protein
MTLHLVHPPRDILPQLHPSRIAAQRQLPDPGCNIGGGVRPVALHQMADDRPSLFFVDHGLSYIVAICFFRRMKKPDRYEIEGFMLGALILGSMVWGLFSGIASLAG